jgi:hypothetical protein
MGCEHVKGPLKPISTTTSNEEIRQTADPESGPRAEIDAFVDLRLTVLPDASEIFFEIGRTV